MQSNNERVASRAQSRSRVDLGAETPPTVLYPGQRITRHASGSYSGAPPFAVISLEMSAERVRANLSVAARLKP